MVQKLAFADVHWMNLQGQFSPQVPDDKAREVVAALQRRPLPSALEWHTGPMPTGHAAAVLAQRVGNTQSSMDTQPRGNTVLGCASSSSSAVSAVQSSRWMSSG